jgi:hypothetical protein
MVFISFNFCIRRLKLAWGVSQILPLPGTMRKSGQTGGIRGDWGIPPAPPVLSQISRRAFPQDYKPIALRVGLQFVGRIR